MTHTDRHLLVFDVQRFCLHDGPGIRTVVFLKGCPLRCRWCQNPESLQPRPELAFYADRCAGCGACTDACDKGGEGRRATPADCRYCGACAAACPHEALRLVGYRLTPRQLLEHVLADRSYFQASGGGVTLSGGEPLLQAAAATSFLRLCREQGIDTTVETCGAVPWASLQAVLPLTNRFFYDLKASDDRLHQELTGSTAERITSNVERLLEQGAEVHLRMPVVPGLNDSPASLDGIAALVRRLQPEGPSLRLLRYHAGGETKIDRLGSAQPNLKISAAQSATAVRDAATRLRAAGIAVTVEGDSKDGCTADRQSRFTDRVWQLRSAVQSSQPEVCAERALLITEYYRKHRQRGRQRRPVVQEKAEAMRHLLAGKRAVIHDHELLVGCFTSKRVGGSVLPELHGVAMLEDLLCFHRRRVNPLRIGAAERRQLALRVLPYWLGRFLVLRAFPLRRALPFIIDQLGAKRYVINESGGISHLVPDYARLLRLGTEGIAAEARERAGSATRPDQADFYRAVEIACQGLEALAAGYVQAAERLIAQECDERRRRELEGIAAVCRQVPRHPARTLQEAFQSLLFGQIAVNLESLDNAVCPGRLDQILLPFYQADLAAGRLDEEGARELVGCFTVKMSEIVPVFSRRLTRIHGGMFSGQTVVVGGTDRQGTDATNSLTWLFLDAMDELRMRQPNYHARLHRHSPTAYLQRIGDLLRRGSGAPSLMNDEAVVPMLVDRGTDLADARDYAPVGCIEPVACGATFGSTDAALVNLALCLEQALGLKRGGLRTPAITGCSDISQVIDLLRHQIDHLVDCLMGDLQAIERANAAVHPTPLTSMLLQGCLESGTDSTTGGATYNGSGVQGVGVVDVADSLAAIEEVVFRRRCCDMAELVAALRADFTGHQELRGHLLKAPKYGNDDSRADRYADQVIAIFADSLARYTNTRGGAYHAGFYSVTAHAAFGQTTGALPSGRGAGKPLANGLSPANGADRLGPTAALCSVTSLDLQRARNGINVNLKLDSGAVTGSTGADVVTGLIQGYCDDGGMQVQLNVLDPAVLEEAREHPDRHPWLLVRVSGYSAYFNDLSPEMKQEIIDRSCHAAHSTVS